MSSLCSNCPWKLKTLNEHGECVWTEKGKNLIEKNNGEYEKMPCAKCELDFLSGTNFLKGRSFVSRDAMEQNEGTDFDDLDPLYKSEYIMSKEDQYDVILLPISSLLHISSILRTLEPQVRALVEYKLENPNEMLSNCARVIGIDLSKTYTYINRVKKQHPLLNYILTKDNRKMEDAMVEQKEKDQIRYKKIEDNLNNYTDFKFVKEMRPLAHFFDLNVKELDEYWVTYKRTGKIGKTSKKNKGEKYE